MKKGAHFYGLQSTSLISLSQLCDNDCITILNNNEINIIKVKTIILKLHRKNTDVLWDIPISIPVRHCALKIITKDKTKTGLIQYLHG